MPRNHNARQNIEGINRTLMDAIRGASGTYNLSQDDLNLIERLLRTPWQETEIRKNLAKEIADSILDKHGKGETVKIGIATLSDIEGRISELQGHIRDHVVHAVLTFLLGVYINVKLNLGVSPLEWKLCALLHDIGYPFEMAIGLPNKIKGGVNEYNQNLGTNSPDLTWRWTFKNLEKLTDGRSSLRLLSSRFRKWRLQPRSAVLFRDMMKNDDMDHGIVSSLLVLKITDMIYRHYNPNFALYIDSIDGVDYSYRHFKRHIINAASAIFLHNIDRDNFNTLRLNFDNRLHVIPALLKLADELQDWERPSAERPVYSAREFSIQASATPKRLTVEVPRDRVKYFEWLSDFFSGIDIDVHEKASMSDNAQLTAAN